MQWLLQDLDDTHKLATTLDGLGLPYSWHKVVPFLGELIPEPIIEDPDRVVMFGSYALWRYADMHGLKPGIFRIEPFLHRAVWHPFLVNGTDAQVLSLRDIPEQLVDDGRLLFIRPIEDNKEIAGSVKSTDEILDLARKVLALDLSDIPIGSLRHDTQLMLTRPVRILQEWRLWVVAGKIVTYSLYREGAQVVYRPEIDDDALRFAQQMVELNHGYAAAYVIDVCRTEAGLQMLETNCLNAAGFYAADLGKLATAIEDLPASP
ncbi:ATP-grasp domain-containing protein [Actibacterium sp. 188UL27-1]|uniref:ATP-grasp domain-containing protein n=1 Tax=Actibacterium sp. 188UL27-1 TaxID=2786961 RepID=UPI001956523B|nr:ATP-grasp domain-containing protein [Actibacterium sp. 188UL27-1]MBM7066138.1 ATP-grasp domain-containing protein [Actibacterium sp. 188UL27-1]